MQYITRPMHCKYLQREQLMCADCKNRAERFVEDAPKVRFEEKRKLLESKRKSKM